MRRKIYAEALEAKDSMNAMVVFNMMKQEQKEDRSLALEERRVALEEENAKQEWKRKELEDARSALRLLPAITAILMDSEGSAEERLRTRGSFSRRGGVQSCSRRKRAKRACRASNEIVPNHFQNKRRGGAPRTGAFSAPRSLESSGGCSHYSSFHFVQLAMECFKTSRLRRPEKLESIKLDCGVDRASSGEFCFSIFDWTWRHSIWVQARGIRGDADNSATGVGGGDVFRTVWIVEANALRLH